MPVESNQGFSLTTNIMVPMRDGVRLAGDLYLPAGEPAPSGGRWPTILIRTPYNKADRVRLPDGPFWARHGYACFIQDCRGRYASEGTFYKYTGEATDGYDTVEWLATQPWCDGNIGTTGTSYLCHVQTSMAVLRPPHLKAMFCIKGGFYNAHTSGVRQGGAFEARQIVWALKQARVSPEAAQDPVVAQALDALSMADWMRMYPYKRGYSPVSPIPSYEDYLWDQMEHEDYSDFWKQVGLNTEEYLEQVADVPTVYLSAWYDIYSRSTVEFFTNLSRCKTQPIKLIMEGGTHDTHGRLAGDIDMGPEASIEGQEEGSLDALQVRWFDRWLKHIENGAESDSPVRYFRLGGGDGQPSAHGRLLHGGTWRTASTWPPEQSRAVEYYLGKGGSLFGQAHGSADEHSAYIYDPRHPVPTIGGNVFDVDDILWSGPCDQRERPEFFLCRPPYMPLACRPDVLVFRTEPLAAPLDVTGTIVVRLFVASSAVDTDFTVKIIDEYPPSAGYPRGCSLNITHGIVRCRYRNSREQAQLMEPGKVYEVQITCYPTSNLFAAGHRLRLDISSSNYPHFDVNPNTGEPYGTSQRMVTADNRVYHNSVYPSHILLPKETPS